MTEKSNHLVALEKEEEVSLISLNDEGSFNSLSKNLLNELFEALKEAEEVIRRFPTLAIAYARKGSIYYLSRWN